MVAHLRNRKDRRKQMLKKLLCMVWKCAICGPILKRQWLRHLSKVIAGIDQIYLSRRPREDWPALQRKINRAEGEYCRVEIEDGTLVVFTNAAIGELVLLAQRDDLLQAVIDAATFRGRAISTSRGWEKPGRKGKKPEWSRVSWLPITLEDARRVVSELGLTEPKYAEVGGSYVVVELPDDWFGDDEKGYKAFCRHLERGPSKLSTTESELGEEHDDIPGGQKA